MAPRRRRRRLLAGRPGGDVRVRFEGVSRTGSHGRPERRVGDAQRAAGIAGLARGDVCRAELARPVRLRERRPHAATDATAHAVRHAPAHAAAQRDPAADGDATADRIAVTPQRPRPPRITNRE